MFGSAYKMPHREKKSNAYLPLKYNKTIDHVSEKLKEANAIFISIDVFSDVQSRSSFHTVTFSPIPLHISSFALGKERKSAVNINKKLYEVLVLSETTQKLWIRNCF